MRTENYRNVIIGSGEGGKVLAWHLARPGQQTAIIERRRIGGSCPNINCLPSKNEIWSAKVADLIDHAGKFGSTAAPAAVDMAAVRNRKREMVHGLVKNAPGSLQDNRRRISDGRSKVHGPRTIAVRLNDGGTRSLPAELLFLNLGTHAAIPPVPGLAESAPLTNIELLELDRVPEHLAEIVHIFTEEGINVVAPAEIVSVSGHSGDGVNLLVRTPAGQTTISGSDILVATGRTPNTTGIGLESAGVKLDPRGYILVNDRLETTAPNVWAIGECAGSPQFTDVSLDDFRIIRDNLSGGRRTTRDRVIPSCLFTEPQVAHVGLTETEANRQGIAVRAAKLPAAAVLRTRTIGETGGFMKALIDPKNDRILGFTMVGPEAGEVLAVVQMARRFSLHRAERSHSHAPDHG